MSFVQTRVQVNMFVARCDTCGVCAGEPATTETAALRLAEKRWGFRTRGPRLYCQECIEAKGGALKESLRALKGKP